MYFDYFTVHYQKIVHRDIKPSNLLLGDDGHLKVCKYQYKFTALKHLIWILIQFLFASVLE